MTQIVTSISDLTDLEIEQVLGRAAELCDGARPDRRDAVVGLVFLEPSLRTRIGFAAAAARLGATSVEVGGRRSNAPHVAESVDDTLRVVAGQCDLVIARTPRPIGELVGAVARSAGLLNAGDAGPAAEHPSQALIDVFSVRTMRGPLAELTIALCGDLRMRSVRSLVRLLEHLQVGRVVVVTADPLTDQSTAGYERRQPWNVGDVDVLYVAGIPDGAVDEATRTDLRVTTRALAALPPGAIVLSPMPVIDEIAHNARGDHRIRLFEQSDLGLPLRIALLELLLG